MTDELHYQINKTGCEIELKKQGDKFWKLYWKTILVVLVLLVAVATSVWFLKPVPEPELNLQFCQSFYEELVNCNGGAPGLIDIRKCFLSVESLKTIDLGYCKIQ